MSDFVATYPTARKRHPCDMCGWSVRPGEVYRRGVGFDGGTAWTWRECLWCERVTAAYARGRYDDEYLASDVQDWLYDEHPATYALMRAGWSYPDGERTPLPLQPWCITCGALLNGWRLWCPPCEAQRIARISEQLAALSNETHERTTR